MFRRAANLLGLGRRPAGAGLEGTPPTDPPARNPVQALLDDVGLPWRSPRAALAARYGVRAHPGHGWEVIVLPTSRPLVDGLLWPIAAQAFAQFSPAMPATYLWSAAWFEDDARGNLERAAHSLTGPLGRAPIIDRNNTAVCEWTFGATSLTLMVWPPELQSGRLTNPSHDRDPRLKTACHVAIETGWRPPLTAQEAEWVATFTRTAPISGAAGDRIFAHPPTEDVLEFTREPTGDLRPLLGAIGLSADRQALMFVTDQLYLVAMDRVLAFHVERTRPARGRGGSRLQVRCQPQDRGAAPKLLTIAAAEGVEDLNSIGAQLAEAVGRPCELGAYADDD